MREEFFISRQGKRYVLVAGLLDEAHQRGLKRIDTELIQVPSPENGEVAITKAVVELEDGRTFSGIGDASPENVGKNIAKRLIAMSETRGKARALRDAVNVGVTALEELSDSDGHWKEAERQAKENQERHLKEVPKDVPKSARVIGENGAEQLYRHMLEHGWSSSDVGEYEKSHAALAELTDEEGRELWKSVKAGVKA